MMASNGIRLPSDEPLSGEVTSPNSGVSVGAEAAIPAISVVSDVAVCSGAITIGVKDGEIGVSDRITLVAVRVGGNSVGVTVAGCNVALAMTAGARASVIVGGNGVRVGTCVPVGVGGRAV